jgi:hypothetical protein
MGKTRKIEVTPNMIQSAEELRKAVASLPAGDLKARAEAALDFITRAFENHPESTEERKCPVNTTIIRA